MKWLVYRLHFKSPLHIGEEGIGAEKIVPYIPSDTLWGAVASAHVTLGLPFDFAKPPFAISSAFPFVQNHYFFPVPLGGLDGLLKQAAEQDEIWIKKIKKINYLEKSVFEQIISGQKLQLNRLFIPEAQDEFLVNARQLAELFPIYRIYEVPRITVDRLQDSAAEGQIFYFSQMVFQEQAGLFFMAHFANEQAQKHLEAALHLLGDEGLGADRTVGRGFFEVEKTEVELNLPEKPNAFTTLSLYFPKQDELKLLLNDQVRYRLVKRKGYAAHVGVRGKRRGMVRMFAEGSLFVQPPPKTPIGEIPIVIERSPEKGIPFPVYRYGRAFTIPVRFAQEAS